MSLGQRIRDLRKRNGLTQTDLANKIGLQFGTVSKYEKDEISIPAENLSKIADVLDTTTDYLLGRNTTINEPIALAASTKNKIDISGVSDEDRKAIERFIEMAKSKNK